MLFFGRFFPGRWLNVWSWNGGFLDGVSEGSFLLPIDPDEP